MFKKVISATGVYPLPTAGDQVVSSLKVRVSGLVGSITPQIGPDMGGNSETPPDPVDVQYTNYATGVAVTAGTAITADGDYQIPASGATVYLNVTSLTGTVALYINPLIGEMSGGSSGGGSGGSVTGTDADNAVNSTTKLPVIAGVANAASPSWTEGHEVPISVDLSGRQRVISTSAAAAADNSTNSTAKTPVIPATANAASPSWTEAHQAPLSVDLSGNLRILSAGSAADNSTNGTAKLPTLGGRANAAAPTWTEGNQVPLSTDLAGNLRALTTSAAAAADNSTNSTAKTPVLAVTANAAAPSWTEGRQAPLSADLSGNARVIPAATEVHLGQIGGTTTNIAPTLAVTVAAYSAGNCVGGLLTLTSAMRISGGSGAWAKLTITDHANQKAPLDILLFKSSPAGTFTDHAAFPTMTAADNALVSARISIAASDWVTVGGSAYVTKLVGPLPVTASGSANLYAAMNTSGTPTYAATTDLNAIFGFFCD